MSYSQKFKNITKTYLKVKRASDELSCPSGIHLILLRIKRSIHISVITLSLYKPQLISLFDVLKKCRSSSTFLNIFLAMTRTRPNHKIFPHFTRFSSCTTPCYVSNKAKTYRNVEENPPRNWKKVHVYFWNVVLTVNIFFIFLIFFKYLWNFWKLGIFETILKVEEYFLNKMLKASVRKKK